MPNTPGNAPPSINRVDQVMESTRQRLAPEQARFRQSQDPQIQAVMAWLATPEADEFLRRIVAQQQGAPGGPAGPGPAGPGGPGGPPGVGPGGPGGPPGGPGAWAPGPGGRGGPPSGGHMRPHQPPMAPPLTAPGMGPSPAPGVPGGERDLSDPASFGPQGQHPLAGIGRAISGAFEHSDPYFDEATGRTLYPGDPGYRQRDSRGQIIEELAAAQIGPGPRFGPRR